MTLIKIGCPVKERKLFFLLHTKNGGFGFQVDKCHLDWVKLIMSERGESKMNDSQKMKWYTLAFMCFSTLWGFGNVLNGFMYFNGI